MSSNVSTTASVEDKNEQDTVAAAAAPGGAWNKYEGDPAGLVGKEVKVEGRGVGRVRQFKRRSIGLLHDSMHTVEFASGELSNTHTLLAC